MVKDSWGTAERIPGSFPSGATLREGSRAWVLTEDPSRCLGGALAWASSVGVSDLHLVVVSATRSVPGSGLVARRAAEFAAPPTVWVLVDRELRPAGPAPLEPEPALPAAAADLAGPLAETGADVLVEHGTLLAEVLGLEVARVELEGGEPVLAVGVGRHDREARRMLHAGLPEPADPWEELRRVVATVRSRRRAGVASHPANQLAPERWLRSVLVSRPGLVGARQLAPASTPEARRDLRHRSPAPAVGTDADGSPVVVVASTGIDPELVPVAADARLAAAGTPPVAPRLVLAVPEPDDHPVTRRLAAALAEPAEVRAVPADWRSLSAGS